MDTNLDTSEKNLDTLWILFGAFSDTWPPLHMSRKSLHCKSLVLGYYPILPEMFWSSGFLIFRRKNRWKIIFDGSYGKLFSRSFSFYFSADFSIHSFLNNSWGNFVYKRNQGVECHGNHRTQLHQMETEYLLQEPI